VVILEKIPADNEVVVYQETQKDREEFVEETQTGFAGDKVHFAMNLYDPSSRYYKYPEYQTWYINKMLRDGYSIVGYSVGFIFSRPKDK
jgi:hypothetical protein